MLNEEDNKALQLLEKAVYKAQTALEKTTCFQPFLLLLTDAGKEEIYENKIEDSTKSYTLLEEVLTKRLLQNDIDIMILVVDTIIPDKFAENVSVGIRMHLEEKSQKDKKIGARYLYVPYELCQSTQNSLFVRLHAPIPVGFPAEYIV
jgi:hypothetical protein